MKQISDYTYQKLKKEIDKYEGDWIILKKQFKGQIINDLNIFGGTLKLGSSNIFKKRGANLS